MGPRRVKNKGPGDTEGVNGAKFLMPEPCICSVHFVLGKDKLRV